MWPDLRLKWPQVDLKSTWSNSNNLTWLHTDLWLKSTSNDFVAYAWYVTDDWFLRWWCRSSIQGSTTAILSSSQLTCSDVSSTPYSLIVDYICTSVWFTMQRTVVLPHKRFSWSICLHNQFTSYVLITGSSASHFTHYISHYVTLVCLFCIFIARQHTDARYW